MRYRTKHAKTKYDKKKEIWRKQKEERERIKKLKSTAMCYKMNDMVDILRVYAEDDPYYAEVLKYL